MKIGLTWASILLAFAVMGICSVSLGEVYQWKDKQGTSNFSDKPPLHGTQYKKIKLQEVQSYSAKPLPPQELAKKKTKEKKAHVYEHLRFVSPINQTTIWDNNGIVNVTISVEPGLQKDDHLLLFMDGRKVGKFKTTSINLKNVNRGAHSLQAKITDQKNKIIISSDTITFYLHRTVAKPKS